MKKALKVIGIIILVVFVFIVVFAIMSPSGDTTNTTAKSETDVSQTAGSSNQETPSESATSEEVLTEEKTIIVLDNDKIKFSITGIKSGYALDGMTTILTEAESKVDYRITPTITNLTVNGYSVTALGGWEIQPKTSRKDAYSFKDENANISSELDVKEMSFTVSFYDENAGEWYESEVVKINF